MSNELRDAIELVGIGAGKDGDGYRSYPGTGSIWCGRNEGIADANFVDWGLARATALILNAVVRGDLVPAQTPPDGFVSVQLLNIERAVSDDLREQNAKLRAQGALKLGDMVQVNERAPFFSDWRGATMKVVSLRIDPEGKQWVSVIAGKPHHRGNGVYDGETTDFDAEYLSAFASTSSECPGCGKIEADSTHAEGCSFASMEGK